VISCLRLLKNNVQNVIGQSSYYSIVNDINMVVFSWTRFPLTNKRRSYENLFLIYFWTRATALSIVEYTLRFTVSHTTGVPVQYSFHSSVWLPCTPWNFRRSTGIRVQRLNWVINVVASSISFYKRCRYWKSSSVTFT